MIIPEKLKSRKTIVAAATIVIAAIVLLVAAAHIRVSFDDQARVAAGNIQLTTPAEMEPGLAELPDPAGFVTVASNDRLSLQADPATGHFKVEDKRNGNTYYSYPDPEQWLAEPQKGTWRHHLRSPLMLEYKDLSETNSRNQIASFLSLNGELREFHTVDQGFSVTFDMPAIGLSVPVRVTLHDDYVQTEIRDDELVEQFPVLLWLRLYPFFGAEHTAIGEEGYVFVPDGSGALIDFVSPEFASNQVYNEPVYGKDGAFDSSSARGTMKNVSFPVFGIASGEKTFVAIIDEGAAYSNMFASPAGVFSNYNWATVQHNYRSPFKMIPDKSKPDDYFISYNEEERFGENRVVRYYPLDSDKNGYVAMAEQVRHYVQERFNLEKLTPGDHLPLQLALIGAGTQSGFISDRTIDETTASDAMQIIRRLYGLGVNKMEVTWLGWQNGGFSKYGGNFPVEKSVGGTKQMADFVKFAHSMEIPVYFNIDYNINTTGDDGFSSRLHGARDLAGTLLTLDGAPIVSTQFALQTLRDDLEKYKDLGIDGLELQHTGTYLGSDYNAKFGGSRKENEDAQVDMLREIADALGGVRTYGANLYALDQVDAITRLPNDYSYNIFSTRAVPFLQIVLHGLVPYTSEYINNHDRYERDILKDIEYGSNPAFVATWNDNLLKYSYGLRHIYSSKFEDWESEIVKQYQRYNDALASLQDQFIVDHAYLSEEVAQTVYEDGTTIVVNYGSQPYRLGKYTVPALDFLVLREE